MQNNIKQSKKFIRKYYIKTVLVLLVFTFLQLALSLPYINIIRIYFAPFSYLVALFIFFIVFKPHKIHLLLLSLIFWLVGAVLALFIPDMQDNVSTLVFFTLLGYILYSIKDIRNDF